MRACLQCVRGWICIGASGDSRDGDDVVRGGSGLLLGSRSGRYTPPLTSFFPSDESLFFGHLSYSFLSSKQQLYSHTLLLYAYSELQCGFSGFSQWCNVRKGSLCTIDIILTVFICVVWDSSC